MFEFSGRRKAQLFDGPLAGISTASVATK